MVDSKTRKVIVLENPMLPIRIKHIIASTLLEHLQVPSLSFALTPLCALLSIGRITGLVLDVGNLETCILPVSISTEDPASAYAVGRVRAETYSICPDLFFQTSLRTASDDTSRFCVFDETPQSSPPAVLYLQVICLCHHRQIFVHTEDRVPRSPRGAHRCYRRRDQNEDMLRRARDARR